MSDNEMNNMEEDVIVFEDEDGNEYNYTVVDYMFYNGEEYALLVEASDEEPEDGQQANLQLVQADALIHFRHNGDSGHIGAVVEFQTFGRGMRGAGIVDKHRL